METVVEVRTREEASSLQSAWRELAEVTPQANFFQSWDWLTTYADFLPATSSLRIYAVVEGERVVGIFPMVLCEEHRRVGTMRVLTPALDSWGTLFTPLGHDPQQVLTSVLRHLRNQQRDWSILSLRWLDERNGRMDVDRALDEAGWRYLIAKEHRGVLVDCRRDWEQYWRSRPKKWRHNLERLSRKLARELGEPRFCRWRGVVTEPDRSQIWQSCQQVARASWQAEAEKGVPLCDPSHLPFLEALHHTAAQHGYLDVTMMFVDQRPVAFGYNLVFQGRVTGFRVGYDQQFRSYGVGMQLARFTLEDSFRRGDEWFDFGIDYLGYKKHLETHEYVTREYEHYSAWSLRSQLLRCKHAIDSWWSPAEQSLT